MSSSSSSLSSSSSPGFLSSVTSQINSLASELGKTFNKVIEEVDRGWFNAIDQRFRRAFKVPEEEGLYGEFWAQCLNASNVNSCTCYVSSNYFSFIVSGTGQKTQVILPLREVVNIQKAVSLRTSSKTYVIQPLTDPTMKSDAIQIFTSDLKVHQFFGFMQFEKAYNALMYAWTASRQRLNPPPMYPIQQGHPQQQAQGYQTGYPVPPSTLSQSGTQPANVQSTSSFGYNLYPSTAASAQPYLGIHLLLDCP